MRFVIHFPLKTTSLISPIHFSVPLLNSLFVNALSFKSSFSFQGPQNCFSFCFTFIFNVEPLFTSHYYPIFLFLSSNIFWYHPYSIDIKTAALLSLSSSRCFLLIPSLIRARFFYFFYFPLFLDCTVLFFIIRCRSFSIVLFFILFFWGGSIFSLTNPYTFLSFHFVACHSSKERDTVKKKKNFLYCRSVLITFPRFLLPSLSYPHFFFPIFLILCRMALVCFSISQPQFVISYCFSCPLFLFIVDLILCCRLISSNHIQRVSIDIVFWSKSANVTGDVILNQICSSQHIALPYWLHIDLSRNVSYTIFLLSNLIRLKLLSNHILNSDGGRFRRRRLALSKYLLIFHKHFIIRQFTHILPISAPENTCFVC